MKKKFYSVIFLLIFIIAFINITQFAWVFYSYRTTKKQYQELLNQALRTASLEYTQWKVLEYEQDIKNSIEIIVVPPDTTKGGATKPTKTKRPSSKETFVATLPNPYRRMYKSETRNPYAFNKEVFSSFFKKQLEKERIRTAFVIDTFHIKNDFGSLEQKEVLHPGFPVQTDAIRLNVFSKLAVASSVKNYPQFVLGRIFLVLVFSLIAIVVANLFLFHVLRRISKEKKAREIRDDFISNITHEIKTPIAIITSALDTLLFHTGLDNKEKVMKYLNTSRKEIEHLNNMVDKLMDSALENEVDLSQRSPIDISDLINTILDKYRLLYGTEVTVIYQVLENKRKVLVDQLHFANAISNIVENAIKYSDAPAVLQITSSVTEEKCIISIADNGIGINSKYHTILFDKFFRVPGSSYKQGNGLGLYYTRKVVENHRGEISLQSVEGKGATFIINIPVE